MKGLGHRKSHVGKRRLLNRTCVDTTAGRMPSRMTAADLATRLIQTHGLLPSVDATDQTLHVTLARLIGIRDDATIRALGTLHLAGVLSSETTVRLAILHARQQKFKAYKLHFNAEPMFRLGLL